MTKLEMPNAGVSQVDYYAETSFDYKCFLEIKPNQDEIKSEN